MAGHITIVGLGPGDYQRIPAGTRNLLLNPDVRVIVRTLEHPAARHLSELRAVESGDDLYESAETFDLVYEGLAERVVEAGSATHVIFAVPGSPNVGERTPGLIREYASRAGVPVEVLGGESFLDLALSAVGVDPIGDGLVVLDGHHLPDPLLLQLPTIITQVDVPILLIDVRDRLARLLPDATPVTVLTDLGTAQARVETIALEALGGEHAGLRTSLFLKAMQVGLPGLIGTMKQLRAECPWDREQTHHSLVRNVVEETYELVEALSLLPVEAPAGRPDFVAYDEVEDELGDVLLQVLFHSTMASEAGAFDIEDVAERLREKLVRRHPHVFGDGEAATAQEVLQNWERIKQDEKQRSSLMDDVPAGLPGMERAAKLQRRAATVGFDWEGPAPLMDKVREEVAELDQALGDRVEAEHELGDLLFSAVNLARHLHIDPEVALRRAVARFGERFRRMEESGDLTPLSPLELDELWESAKAELEDFPENRSNHG
ncbi:MAG: nucleoside triphosphate pyrophosphohydrolase [Acidimicrobiia bacterium]|nr:nucleoside triphosphate pyrophosphohydrolase [Acidimicrobiia bacterium]MDH3396361.1 nucleoside triphosphate pyrophosphohydrolase [Acidimicrobiia bacterium]MDH5615315.1 nucleoside triphosphate pyrophosphohydrolase [Acidimicrobiia bacterium]